MAERILIGSANPSKIQSLARRLSRFSDVVCCSPVELGLDIRIPETGKTMAENALLKARAFHEASGLPVLSGDSGLYFAEFPLEDPRQPGSHIRRVGGRTLDDGEMIDYYGGLARQYGALHACYCNAFAAVDESGRAEVFFQDDPKDPDFFDAFGFLLCAEPHEKRNPGWPLDSLSMDPYFRRYWFEITDEEYNIPELAFRRRNEDRFNRNLNHFLEHFFGLTEK